MGSSANGCYRWAASKTIKRLEKAWCTLAGTSVDSACCQAVMQHFHHHLQGYFLPSLLCTAFIPGPKAFSTPDTLFIKQNLMKTKNLNMLRFRSGWMSELRLGEKNLKVLYHSKSSVRINWNHSKKSSLIAIYCMLFNSKIHFHTSLIMQWSPLFKHWCHIPEIRRY